MLSLNQSTIKAASCPFRFSKLKARKGHKTDSQEAVTSVGRAIHSFADRYFKHCWESGVQTDLEAGRRIAESLLTGEGLGEAERADFLQLAEGFLTCEMAPVRQTAAVEEVVHTPDKQFYGTPDLVELPFCDDPEAVRISDWKSWRRIRPAGEMRAEIQLPLYAGIVAELNPAVERFYLRYVFLRYGKEYPAAGKAADWCLSREEVLAFMGRMRQRAAELDAMTEFPARAGTACDWCECSGECPLIEAKEISVLRTAEQARGAAEQVYALDSLVKRLRARLKAWVDTNGEVELDGVKLTYVPQLSRKYDLAEVVKAFQCQGVKVTAVLGEATITQTGIKRVGKAAGVGKEAVAEVLALGSEETRTAFKFAKADGEDGEEDGQ